jgi:hypothetical protein
MTTASALIERARSLADLVNSKFISYDDEVSSLNESYRDIYSWLCNNNDDYFVKEYVTTITQNIANDPNAAIVALPADFYKLRFIDYQYQGYWSRVRKYSTEARDNNPSSPQYRFYGNDLRIIGLNPNGANGNLRLVYYPPADIITLPEYAYAYGTSIAAYNKSLVNEPFYVSQDNSLIYVYNGTSIRVESIDNNTVSTPVTIYTSTGLSHIQYYKGYVYFLKGNEIYRGTSDLASTLVPTAITASTGTILDFYIVQGKIYYTKAGEIRSCNLDGTGDTSLLTAVAQDPTLVGGLLAYINVAGNIVVGGVADTSTLAVRLTSDGTYLYWLDPSNQLHRASYNGIALTDDTILRTNVSYLGTYYGYRLPIISTADDMLAVSSIPDWEFSYPLNEVNEIIAYQCAIDFKRKQNADFSQLSVRMQELQQRFLDVMKRDEGLPQKIGNAYSQYDSQWR